MKIVKPLLSKAPQFNVEVELSMLQQLIETKNN